MKTNLVFDHARIAVKDVLIFVPSLEEPLKDNQQRVLSFNGKVTGHLKESADSISGNRRGGKYFTGCFRNDQRIAGCKKSLL